MSRGKKRLGFDINLRVEYQGNLRIFYVYKGNIGRGELEGGQGSISYKDFQEDGDHEVLF